MGLRIALAKWIVGDGYTLNAIPEKVIEAPKIDAPDEPRRKRPAVIRPRLSQGQRVAAYEAENDPVAKRARQVAENIRKIKESKGESHGDAIKKR